MRKLITSLVLCLALLAFFGCTTNDDGEFATVSFNLTDAPLDSQDIQSVFVSFGGLEINQSGSAAESDSTWIEVPITTSQEYDLLSLTAGTTALLGNVPLSAGTQVNQIRFIDPVVEVVESSAPETRIPCALASVTGLKIVKAFQVPLTGTLTLTVDFDVRKSLVYSAGTDEYRIKPVLRAVVEGEAGNIAGAFADGYVVYAYKAGEYASSETTPDIVTGVVFGNSVTSAKPILDDATSQYKYRLAFLEAGNYDLVVVNLSTNAIDSGTYAGLTVASGTTTTQDIATLP